MRNDDRRVESSIEVMSQLPFPNPVEMVGQSSGLVCFRDSISPTFYVWNVTTERVEAKIDEAAGEPRPGFSGEAVYGFGHTKTGSFKIVRVPYPIIEFRKEEQQRKDQRRTSLDIYDSNVGRWEQLEYPDKPLCQPCPEHSCFVPKHGFLFWKVTVNGSARILGVDVNGGRLKIIKPPIVDGFLNFNIGPGSDSQIIGCRFDLLSPALKIWTMMRGVDQEWTWDFVSTIPVSPDPDTSRFLPLLNFSIDDEEYYFFLRNEDSIVGFKSADRKLWHSKVFCSKFDATPLLGFESLQFNAVSVGPRTFKLEEDYTNNDEGTKMLAKQHRGVGKPFRERDKAKR